MKKLTKDLKNHDYFLEAYTVCLLYTSDAADEL